MENKMFQKHKKKIIMLEGLGPPKLLSSWGEGGRGFSFLRPQAPNA